MRSTLTLAEFLSNAPTLFGSELEPDEEVDPDIANGVHGGAIRRFTFPNGETLSCVRWDSQYHITSTDIIRALVHRFEGIMRPVMNMKKFEEGVFSDLRSLKPGTDARLELPRSEFLELLYKHHCVRTQKKQKVFFWDSVPHDLLFREALERDLKREAMGIEPTTKVDKNTDPTTMVNIGGVDLPLTVPPTLAVHSRLPIASSAVAGSKPVTAKVSTATVRISAAPVPAPMPAETVASHIQSMPLVPTSTAGHAVTQHQQQPHIQPQQHIDSSGNGFYSNDVASSALSLASLASRSSQGAAANTGYPRSNSGFADSTDMLTFAADVDMRRASDTSVVSMAMMVPGGIGSDQGIQHQHQPQHQPQQQQQQQHQQPHSLTDAGQFPYTLFNTGSSQPSLSEYISGKSAQSTSSQHRELGIPAGVAPIRDSWTGVDFNALHKQASELKANYEEYQPTPTPYHSPKDPAIDDPEILALLNSTNAMLTQDNVGDFSDILEQLLGSSGQIRESSNGAGGGFSLDASAQQQQQQQLLWDHRGTAGQSAAGAQQPAAVIPPSSAGIAQSGGVLGDDVEMAAGSSRAASAILDSMVSSPSVANSSSAMSPHDTPGQAAFSRGVGSSSSTGLHGMVAGDTSSNSAFNAMLSMEEINDILASNGMAASRPPPSISGSSMASASGNEQQQKQPSRPSAGAAGFSQAAEMQSLIPMFGLADAEMAERTGSSSSANNGYQAGSNNASGVQSIDVVKQLWERQKATTRSTRFSRFHPYLKTMHRIAHRDTPSIINRVPSTADPSVAAAAVGAMAAFVANRQQAYAPTQTQPQQPHQSMSLAASSTASNNLLAFDTADNGALQGFDFGKPALPSSGSGSQQAAQPACTKVAPAVKKETNGKPAKPAGKSRRSSRNEAGNDCRRFPCTFAGCTKLFKRQEHLKRHFRTHTGERPYKCPAPDCGKVFARMDNLNQHVRTHVNRKTAHRRSSKSAGDNALAQLTDMAGMDVGDEEMQSAFSGFVDGLTGNAIDGTVSSEMLQQASNGRPMRIAMPTENAGAGPQPLQSPLMENNEVARLRKMSKNNRLRNNASAVNTPSVPIPSSRPDDQISPFFTNQVSNYMDLQPMNAPIVDSHGGLPRTVSTETTSGINTAWLASFLSQGQQQGGSGSVGFTWNGNGSSMNSVSLKRRLDENGEQMQGGSGSVGFTWNGDGGSVNSVSLKRRLDENGEQMQEPDRQGSPSKIVRSTAVAKATQPTLI